MTAANAVTSHRDMLDLEDPENLMPIGAPTWCGPALHETGRKSDRSPYPPTATTPRRLDKWLNQPESSSQKPFEAGV
jgi:hypothetical protein